MWQIARISHILVQLSPKEEIREHFRQLRWRGHGSGYHCCDCILLAFAAPCPPQVDRRDFCAARSDPGFAVTVGDRIACSGGFCLCYLRCSQSRQETEARQAGGGNAVLRPLWTRFAPRGVPKLWL